MLFLLGVVLLLFLVVRVVAEIHGLGDGRNGGGRHQDEIEAQFLRLAQGDGGGHDLGGAVRENRAHFTHANGLVYVLSAILPARRKVSAWIHLVMRRFQGCEGKRKGAGRPEDSLAENRNGVAKRQAQVVSVSVYTKSKRKSQKAGN